MKLAAPVCALLLVLTACGGDTDAVTAAATAAETPAAETTSSTASDEQLKETNQFVEVAGRWTAWIQTMPTNLQIVIGASLGADPAEDAECRALLDGLALAPPAMWGDDALTAASRASIEAARSAYSTCANGGDALQAWEKLGTAIDALLAEIGKNGDRLGLG